MSIFRNPYVIGVIPCFGAFLLVQYLDNKYEQNRLNKSIDFKKELEDFNKSTASKSQHIHSSKQSISKLLEDIKHKTTYEKITDAFDASVKTHEIGFPSSLPSTSTSNTNTSINYDNYKAYTSSDKSENNDKFKKNSQ